MTMRLRDVASTFSLFAAIAGGAAGNAAAGQRAHDADFSAVYPASGAYSAYQAPDGSYPSYGDFIQQLDGIPCDIECWSRAQARWAR